MGALIAAAVADQRSRVPESSVRAKIAEILARQGGQTFFSERTPPTTYRTPSQSTSRALKTRLAPSRTEAPLPLVSIPEGTRLKKNGNEQTMVFRTAGGN